MRVELSVTHPARFYQNVNGAAEACIDGRIVDLPQELAEALIRKGEAYAPGTRPPPPKPEPEPEAEAAPASAPETPAPVAEDEGSE